MEIQNREKKDFSFLKACIVTMVFLLIAVMSFGSRVVGDFLASDVDQLRYDIVKSEGMAKVEVLDVFKQKGKETLYKIHVTYEEAGFPDSFREKDTLTIPESVYLEHVGEGNNAVTVKLESLYVFKGALRFSLNSGLVMSFDVSEGYGVTGKAMHIHTLPWEEEKHFTDEDVIQLAEYVSNDNYAELLDEMEEEVLGANLKAIPKVEDK